MTTCCQELPRKTSPCCESIEINPTSLGCRFCCVSPNMLSHFPNREFVSSVPIRWRWAAALGFMVSSVGGSCHSPGLICCRRLATPESHLYYLSIKRLLSAAAGSGDNPGLSGATWRWMQHVNWSPANSCKLNEFPWRHREAGEPGEPNKEDFFHWNYIFISSNGNGIIKT